jgi:hypothetical protein
MNRECEGYSCETSTALIVVLSWQIQRIGEKPEGAHFHFYNVSVHTGRQVERAYEELMYAILPNVRHECNLTRSGGFGHLVCQPVLQLAMNNVFSYIICLATIL